jgi:hypothetical protein
MMSTTEYVIIAVSIGIIILGVPLISYLWTRNRDDQEVSVIVDEQTPLRSKIRDEHDDIEEGISFDSSTLINRVLSNGIILHTTKGPKKVRCC